jgi:hypothetical protein
MCSRHNVLQSTASAPHIRTRPRSIFPALDLSAQLGRIPMEYRNAIGVQLGSRLPLEKSENVPATIADFPC